MLQLLSVNACCCLIDQFTNVCTDRDGALHNRNLGQDAMRGLLQTRSPVYCQCNDAETKGLSFGLISN